MNVVSLTTRLFNVLHTFPCLVTNGGSFTGYLRLFIFFFFVRYKENSLFINFDVKKGPSPSSRSGL